MYKLEYLDLAKQDMVEIASYISRELNNPQSAEKLADEMIKAAENLVKFPYSNRVHLISAPLKQEYRRLIVKNYIMLYCIDEKEKKVTIARVIYSRRDYEKMPINEEK
ncbi:MAG: type II toxin-antitoxin system RelE/ParE family toxin [Defluviitaleaceae bacterium]|nr:type II toxin-antitoxin system RelE/ParE family toxin [Defluviitaleaceae bacterium]